MTKYTPAASGGKPPRRRRCCRRPQDERSDPTSGTCHDPGFASQRSVGSPPSPSNFGLIERQSGPPSPDACRPAYKKWHQGVLDGARLLTGRPGRAFLRWDLQVVLRSHLRTSRSPTARVLPFARSKARSNGSQYACRRVDDGYGLVNLALPQRIFGTPLGDLN